MDKYLERKKMIYDFMCDDMYVPMKIKELAIVLGVKKEQRPELEQILADLMAEGRIEISKRGKYGKSEVKRLVGTFTAHPKGFGFVTVEGENEDIFIPEQNTAGAMHLDQVEVVVTSHVTGRRREGAITKILARGMKLVVGTYEQSKTFGFVVPDNVKFGQDIFVPQERSKGAVSGHKVVVELTSYGKRDKKPEGKVVEILGHINDPGVDILSLVRAYHLPVEFGEKVLNQVERVAKPVSEADMAGRMDLREWQMVTIDGEDAKDLDDAVSLTRDGENYILGVHIADVTNYVQEHSALDVEAQERGTSVYLVDRVIPMLPHALSNGICSLNQGEDRLALSCIMTVNPKGEVVDHRITESVIRVDRRMSYTVVNQILSCAEQLRRAAVDGTLTLDSAPATDAQAKVADSQELRAILLDHRTLIPMFEGMAELAGILRERRHKRGSIDFDMPETKVILDENGKPLELRPYERNVATNLIEDFMLAANETVAAEYYWREFPFVYRTHEKPDCEKIQKLSTFINNFGYHLHVAGDEVHPKELQKLLGRIEGSEEEALITRLTLRSMKQARYTVENTGHFGLAADCYCHFTSPIRRYPDLQIHRMIKEDLRGRWSDKRMEHYERILPEVCKHSSEMERRAEEAERETIKLKKAEYMEGHIGESFDGVISGVTEWGFFVELPNTIEGLVRVTSLQDDFYQFYEESYELVGEVTNKSYKLGQRVRVCVDDVDLVMRTIDFVVDEER